MSHSLPHLTLTTSTSSLSPSSPVFPTISPTHRKTFGTRWYLPCDVPRQSGGSTQIPSLTGCEPKVIETIVIETEAVEPEGLEPRRIELDKNLGTDPYQIQERFMRNNNQVPITEDVDEFGKVGAEMSYIQWQMHSDYDSAENIADSARSCVQHKLRTENKKQNDTEMIHREVKGNGDQMLPEREPVRILGNTSTVVRRRSLRARSMSQSESTNRSSMCVCHRWFWKRPSQWWS